VAKMKKNKIQSQSSLTMADVFILMYPLNGRDLAFHIPFSVMQTELDVHQSMFPNINVTSELYRRLQVRVCSAMLRIVEDHISQLYERDFFIMTQNGIELESGLQNGDTSAIPIAAVDLFYDTMFQIMLVKDRDHIDNNTKLITVPSDVMSSVYENEKEDALMAYMDQRINEQFDSVAMLCDAFEKLTIK
jgi:hypothetical protein